MCHDSASSDKTKYLLSSDYEQYAVDNCLKYLLSSNYEQHAVAGVNAFNSKYTATPIPQWLTDIVM